MLTAVFLVGVAVYVYRGFPTFYGLDMLAGAIWCIGNSLCVPIINRIGLGLGLVMWCAMVLVSGWATGITGIMGNNPQSDLIVSWPLNITGVVMALCATILASFIKTTQTPPKSAELHDDYAPFTVNSNQDPFLAQSSTSFPTDSEKNTDPLVDSQAASSRAHIEGIAMGMVAGVMFGVNYNLVQRVIDTVPEASHAAIDHTFAYFSGALALAMVLFMGHACYAHFTDTEPQLFPKVTFPAFLSGIIWVVAQICLFIANSQLGTVISAPLSVVGPSLVGTLLGVFVLKEISGKKNYILILIFFILSSAAAVCILFSRKWED